jgi:hypothetical protein
MSNDRTVPIEHTGRLVRTLRLEVLTGPDASKELVSGSDVVTVGTADGNDLVLGDKTVSWSITAPPMELASAPCWCRRRLSASIRTASSSSAAPA